MAWYLAEPSDKFTFTLPVVRVKARAGNFSLHHRVQTGSGSCPASYTLGTGVPFTCGKTSGAWSWPLTSTRVCPESFWTGRLERELQMLQLLVTRCSCIAILWVSLVSFATISLCVASQRVFVGVYFVIDSVRKLMDTPSCLVARARIRGVILPFPQYAFMAWCSIQAQGQLLKISHDS
jgi:hypothetical protein